MARTTPVVQGEILIWQGDDQKQALTVGSPAWYAWLEDASTFAFVSDMGTFTARKESTRHGGTYWKAYRKREGKLRRAYLGKSRDVTLARLQTAAAVLARQGSRQDAHRVDQAGGERSYHAPSADPAHDSIPQETPFARDQTIDLGRTAHRGDSPAPRASALPTYLTPLLGREQEAQIVCSLLQRSEVRLLTLTGPGGVGKTRLGIQIASDLMHDFANGVCFISLGPISDPELVIATIAQALDLPEAELVAEEIERPVDVADADHGMKKFHRLPSADGLATLPQYLGGYRSRKAQPGPDAAGECARMSQPNSSTGNSALARP